MPAPHVAAALKLLLARRPEVSAGALARELGISRQAAHRHLRRAVERGELEARGRGRGAHYRRPTERTELRFARAGLEEDRVFREVVGRLPALAALPPVAHEVIEYALTEVVNNAVDHSDAESVGVVVVVSAAGVGVEIWDDGVGAFERIRRSFGLESPLRALELFSKGKVTSDPERHRGEELFFVARVVNGFELEANGLRYLVDHRRQDVAMARTSARPGTRVRFDVPRDSRERVRDVLERFSRDYAVVKTHASVRLFSLGARFVSRAEAKRLLSGLERFREVALDFSGVDAVGQGFADEVFRVWAKAHPETRLLPENLGEGVAWAVRRALTGPPAP